MKFLAQPKTELVYGKLTLEKKYGVQNDEGIFLGWVAYCPETKEWIAFTNRTEYLPSYGKSRAEGAALLQDQPGRIFPHLSRSTGELDES